MHAGGRAPNMNGNPIRYAKDCVHNQDRLVRVPDRVLYTLWSFLILFLLGITPGHAQEPSHLILRFAFSELPPWKMKQGDRFIGAYTEIVRELARRMDAELVIVECPLTRCLRMMATGEADIIIGVQDNDERRQYIQFLTTPFLQHGYAKVFYQHKGNMRAINRYEDLYGLRIGVKAGANYFSPFDGDKQLRKEPVNSYEQNFAKLLRDRLDVVIVAEGEGEYYLSTLKLRDQIRKASFRYLDATPRYIGLASNSSIMQQRDVIENAMKNMVDSGSVRAIIEQYYLRAYQIPASVLFSD